MQGLKASESVETVPSDGDSTPKAHESKKTPKSKKIKPSKKDRLNPARFQGEGVSFKAKLIGVEELNEARGDKLCQDTITRLKAAVKSTGTHKQRIWFSISLEGIKIKEDRSGLNPLYHHAVPQISFISQDITDDRAFGYICSPIPNTYHFLAIKTEKAASQVVITLRDLFQTVLNMKQQQTKVEDAEAQEEIMAEGSMEESTESAVEVRETSAEPIYMEADAPDSKEEQCTPPETSLQESALADLLDLQFEPNVQQLEEACDSLILSPSQVVKAVLEQMHVAMSLASIAQMNLSLAFSPFQNGPLLVPQTEIQTAPEPENEFSPPPETDPMSSGMDRYAVFEDLDSAPSIFENPIFAAPVAENSTPSPQRLPLPPPMMDNHAPEKDKEDINDLPPPLVPRDSTNRSFDFSILADLDPLGKDRPYVDKKDFFHQIKNPPKKVLKELMGTSFDSSTTNGVSIRRLESQNTIDLPRIPPRINPFSSSSLPPSTPPPILTMTSRCSDPMFPVTPSPPPHRVARPMNSVEGPQSPPIPIPPRRASPLANGDSPLTMRRAPRLSSGSDKSSPGNWGTFDDNFNDTPSPVGVSKPGFVFPIRQSVSERPKNPFVGSEDEITKASTFNPFIPTSIEGLTPPPTPPIVLNVSPETSSAVFTNSDVFSEPPLTTSPISPLTSPEEGSIFKKKQDPFADDFFQALEKK